MSFSVEEQKQKTEEQASLTQTSGFSQSTSRKKAPKISKNPFPEDFALPSPAAGGRKQAMSKASVKREKEPVGKRQTNTEMATRMKEEEDLLNDVFQERGHKDIDDTFEVELGKYEQPFQPAPV